MFLASSLRSCPRRSASCLKARRAGYNMVEFMLATAIVALSAAIIFPAFERVRDCARRNVCTSNLRQIGLATAQYLQDYDDTLPGTGTKDETLSLIQTWQDMLYPYVKSEQVFTCPNEKTRYVYQVDRNGSAGNPGSYGVNGAYYNNRPGVHPPAMDYRYGSTRLSRIVHPEGTVWVTEVWPGRYTAGAPSGWNPPAPSPMGGYFGLDATSGASTNAVLGRHLDRASVVYCDGHTASVLLSALAERSSTNKDGGVAVLKWFSVEDD